MVSEPVLFRVVLASIILENFIINSNLCCKLGNEGLDHFRKHNDVKVIIAQCLDLHERIFTD